MYIHIIYSYIHLVGTKVDRFFVKIFSFRYVEHSNLPNFDLTFSLENSMVFKNTYIWRDNTTFKH